MKIRTCMLVALCLLRTWAAQADTLVTQLRVRFEKFAIEPADSRSPGQAIFMDRPTIAEVRLVAAALPGGDGSSPPLAYALPVEQWWNQIRWSFLRDGEQQPLSIRPTFLDARIENGRPATRRTALRAGERAIARFRVDGLAPGVYTVRIGLGDLTSSDRFIVSNGTESASLRKEYARYKVLNSKDIVSLKANLRELAAADPLNASPWIRLGDLSLEDGSVEELSEYYGRALDVLDHRRQHFQNAETVQGIDALRSLMRQVKELVPQYVANRSILTLRAEGEGAGKRYVLAERNGGAVIRILRAESPAGGQ